MSLDLTNIILPFINATGIPLLAIGIIVLIVAYQRASQTYKETATNLNEENKRLREILHSTGLDYMEELRKMKKAVSKVDEAVDELTAAKAVLLAPPSAGLLADAKTILEVAKIDTAIECMNQLVDAQSHIEQMYSENQLRINQSIQEIKGNFRDVKLAISQIADQMSDNKSRLLVLSVIAPEKSIAELKKKSEEYPKGLSVEMPELPSSSSLLGKGDENESDDSNEKGKGLLETKTG